jgi:hypothetical protein
MNTPFSGKGQGKGQGQALNVNFGTDASGGVNLQFKMTGSKTPSAADKLKT